MAWNLISSSPAPPASQEAWTLVNLPPVTDIIAYGFMLVVPATTPIGWNTGGFWGVVQGIDGQKIVSRSHPIPLIGRGSSQVLRVIGPQEIDLVPLSGDSLELAYFIHRWVSAVSLDLYALVP